MYRYFREVCCSSVKMELNLNKMTSPIHRFASAIRSGFVYQGTESVTIGGGDDLWLYLNGKFVLEISSRNTGTSVPCKKISLSAASTSGIVFTRDITLIYSMDKTRYFTVKNVIKSKYWDQCT